MRALSLRSCALALSPVGMECVLWQGRRAADRMASANASYCHVSPFLAKGETAKSEAANAKWLFQGPNIFFWVDFEGSNLAHHSDVDFRTL